MTSTLSAEIAASLRATWTDDKGLVASFAQCSVDVVLTAYLVDWHEVQFKSDTVRWCAQLTARIFLGPGLSTNPEWIRIASEYTVDIFQTLESVKTWPRWLYGIAEMVHPLCRKSRAQYKVAERLLRPILAARETALAHSGSTSSNDSLEWVRRYAKRRSCSDVDIQLGLTITSVHTMADLLAQAVINLSKYPEIVPSLRDEAIRVLSKSGTQKAAVTEAHLLDSFVKETQRLKPFLSASLFRRATRDVVLPGGVSLRKGQNIAVAHAMWDEDRYANAAEFDGARFLKRRHEPHLKHISNLVSTSTDFTAFGHGRHACPGRFFAAQTIKLILMHIVLKYDLHMADPRNGDLIEVGFAAIQNPGAIISVKRREEEVDV